MPNPFLLPQAAWSPEMLQFPGLDPSVVGGAFNLDPVNASVPTNIDPGGAIPNFNIGYKNNTGFGFNVPTAQLALQGLGTIGGLLAGFKSLGLAKKQFNFQKNFANENLANQKQAYNTQVEGIGRSRAKAEGMSPADAQAWIDRNRLLERRI